MNIETLEVDELTTPIYQATLRVSPGGPPVPGSALTSLTVWLYDISTGTIINDRNAVELPTTLVDEDGVLQWLMDEDDHPIVSVANPYERHRAEFEVRWDTPEKVMRHTVDFLVGAYAKVPVVVP